VLIGGGSRLAAIYEGSHQPGSLAEITLVLSFKKRSSGLEWAKEQGLEARYWRWSDWKAAGHSRTEYDTSLATLLLEYRIDLVVLAGWGLLLSESFLEKFPGRIINVHPALLTETFEPYITLSDGRSIPVFRGNHAIEEALAAGIDTTGCTVHYVTGLMDAGPVLLQREVPILPGDTYETLADRIHAAEDELLPRAIEIACQKL
jgi:folate-dependent phosphoribosylglycinamide formyltransferase PurN